MKKLTKAQVRKILREAGFDLNLIEFRKGEIEVDPAIADSVLNVLGAGWGGFRTGYGAYIYSQGYRASGLDYCDKSNPIHY